MTKYGQHFLTSTNVIDRIIELAELSPNDVVLEIGPGKGALTGKIATRVKKVYAVEVDKELADEISSMNLENVEVINEDVISYEFPKDITKIVSNLPYQISAPITEKIIDFGKPAVLMYQKEFVDRMLAKPGERDYSRLSVLISHTSKVKLLMKVSRINFSPKPRVDSAVVSLIPNNITKDEKLLYIVGILFRHKRKNVLPALMAEKNFFSLKDKKELRKVLSERIKTKKRVVALSLSELEDIKKQIGHLVKDLP